MKRLLLILAIAAISLTTATTTANAQKKLSDSFMSVGLNAGYGTFYGSLVGINADFNTGTNWRGRLLVQVNSHNEATAVGASVDGHYLINIVGGLNVYPIVGVSAAIHPNWDHSFSFGIDAGAGIEYDFGNDLAIFYETKYQINFVDNHNYANYIGFSWSF